MLKRLVLTAACAAAVVLAAPAANARSGQYSALCGAGNAQPNTNVGSVDSVAGPGLLLASRNRQQLTLSVANLTCLPPPVGPLVVTKANVKMDVSSVRLVNCTDLVNGAAVNGKGRFVWTAPPGMGKSAFLINWSWRSPGVIHFWGSVLNAYSTDVFHDDHVTGYILTKEQLKPKASGGDCTATIPLTHWTIRALVVVVRP